MFNRQSLSDDAFNKNGYQLTGPFARKGYDWWWHSFTAIDKETKEEVPFFVEFFLINPALSPDKAILGQSAEAKEKDLRPSYLMVKAGCWGKHKKQLHRFFALKDVKIKKKGTFAIDADDCHADEQTLRGSIHVAKEELAAHPEMMCDAGEIRFDLQIEKCIAYDVGYGTSWLFRFLKAFEMYWHAQGMKSKFKGSITMDGREYEVLPEKSFGYADKNWGSNFTSPWVWLSSNDIYSKTHGCRYENSVFDIGGGRPKAFGIAMDRKLLSALYLEGQQIEFNFSKFWQDVETEFSEKEDEKRVHWHVEQSNVDYLMATDISCEKSDMLFVNYEDPMGRKRYSRLWNGGNGKGTIKLYKKETHELVEELEVGHVGCEYGEFDA